MYVADSAIVLYAQDVFPIKGTLELAFAKARRSIAVLEACNYVVATCAQCVNICVALSGQLIATHNIDMLGASPNLSHFMNRLVCFFLLK